MAVTFFLITQLDCNLDHHDTYTDMCSTESLAFKLKKDNTKLGTKNHRNEPKVSLPAVLMWFNPGEQHFLNLSNFTKTWFRYTATSIMERCQLILLIILGELNKKNGTPKIRNIW